MRLTPYQDRVQRYSDPVRIGIDVSDWWIDVKLHDVNNKPEKLRAIREALLIVGAFAQLNHGCCMQYLQSTSLFERAKHMDMEERGFYPRFVIDIHEISCGPTRERQRRVNQPEPVDLPMVLNCLLSRDELSDAFVRDWAKVLDMQDRVGLSLTDIKPVELRFMVNPRNVPSSELARHFAFIAESIRGVQATVAERATTPWAERVTLEPCFSVSVLDLYLHSNVLQLEVVHNLSRLMAIGVGMGNVELPATPQIEMRQNERSTWWCA